MKVYIMTDMEGISGVVQYDKRDIKCDSDYLQRQKWGHFLTLEANGAIRGAFESGADNVTVCDGHGKGDLLDLEALDSRASAVIGRKRKAWLPFFDDSYDALILIGAHAMENKTTGVLSHTYSHRTIERFLLNNKVVGEIGVSMAIAGWYGVPTIFISGDKAAVEEAKSLSPEIHSTEVKEGITTLCAKTLHVNQSVKLIESEVQKAVKKLGNIRPFKMSPPFELRVYYKMPLVPLYKWIRAKGNRPQLIPMTGVCFRSQDNLPEILEKFKAF